VDVAGGGVDAGFERLGGLVAGRGAEIEEALAGFEAEERDDGLGADVLNAADVDVLLRRLESGFRDRGGGVGAVSLLPSGEEPLGAGELDFARGPGDGIAIRLAEDGVDEAGCGGLAGALDELDAFLDGGMRRDALEVAELVDGDAERGADFGIELAGAAGVVGDQVIELGAIPEDAEDDFTGETGVAGIERGGAGEEEVGGIAAGFDELEDIEGGAACGGDGHRYMIAQLTLDNCSGAGAEC
jgi:hypothetical protein